MKEPSFIKENAEKWRLIEEMLIGKQRPTPDEEADLFIQLTNDLSYARTYFANSNTARYLNDLTLRVHQKIYKNKKESKQRLLTFWSDELPELMYQSRHHLLLSFLLFALAITIGAFSCANEDSYVYDMLGRHYVNMTDANIKKGDPMAVYKDAKKMDMFIGITINNIRVSFLTFVYGIFFSFGTAYILLHNGAILGAFQFYFYQKGLFLTSFLTIWIHGTLEISAIVIAGCAGFVMGNSILFPGTYSRLESFKNGVKKGLKIMVGIAPLFVVAGFLEGYVTRLTELPTIIKALIIGSSAAFIIWYFVLYPYLKFGRKISLQQLTNS